MTEEEKALIAEYADKIAETKNFTNALARWLDSQNVESAIACMAMIEISARAIAKTALSKPQMLIGVALHQELLLNYAKMEFNHRP